MRCQHSHRLRGEQKVGGENSIACVGRIDSLQCVGWRDVKHGAHLARPPLQVDEKGAARCELGVCFAWDARRLVGRLMLLLVFERIVVRRCQLCECDGVQIGCKCAYQRTSFLHPSMERNG